MVECTSLRSCGCCLLCGLLLIASLLSGPTFAAAQRTLVLLPFEIRDMTVDPDVEGERARAATIDRLLAQDLRAAADVRLVEADPAKVRSADVAVGYLFEHGDAAAELGRALGADWVVVGRVHKPSYLFAYLMARLIDSRSGEVAEDLIVEIKGQQEVVTRKGVERLAQKLSVRLKAGLPPFKQAPAAN